MVAHSRHDSAATISMPGSSSEPERMYDKRLKTLFLQAISRGGGAGL